MLVGLQGEMSSAKEKLADEGAYGLPVYTLTNIIIDKLAGIQLRAVQSQGGAEHGSAVSAAQRRGASNKGR